MRYICICINILCIRHKVFSWFIAWVGHLYLKYSICGTTRVLLVLLFSSLSDCFLLPFVHKFLGNHHCIFFTCVYPASLTVLSLAVYSFFSRGMQPDVSQGIRQTEENRLPRSTLRVHLDTDIFQDVYKEISNIWLWCEYIPLK